MPLNEFGVLRKPYTFPVSTFVLSLLWGAFSTFVATAPVAAIPSTALFGLFGGSFSFSENPHALSFPVAKATLDNKVGIFWSLAKFYKKAGFQCLGIYSISIYLLGSRVLEELGPEGVLNLFKMAVIASECRGGVAPFSIGCSTRSKVSPDNCFPNSWLHDCCSARCCCKWRCISRFTDAMNPLSSSVALKKKTQKL